VRTGAEAEVLPNQIPDKHFWRVVLPTGLTLLLCNMDRICMSVAIMPMADAFGWSPAVQGNVQAAFLWGYMVTQLVGGTLADRFGGKRVIAYAIKVFSLASLALPLALRALPKTANTTLACVVVARFLGAPRWDQRLHQPHVA
jgi:MFS family permease